MFVAPKRLRAAVGRRYRHHRQRLQPYVDPSRRRVWRLRSRLPWQQPWPGPERATAILLSYSRPQNIESIALVLLQCEFIHRVVISNNNPEIHMEDWVKLRDPRVVLRNQTQPTRSGIRWHLAREFGGDYVIAIDDDIFIYPHQVTSLFAAVVSRPDVPHGIFGSRYIGDPLGGAPLDQEYFERVESDVDVLHEGYAVTQEHVDRYFDLLDQAYADGKADSSTVMSWGDDVVMSQTGNGRAQVHDFGYMLRCPSCHEDGVALFREDGFMAYREELFKALQRILRSGR